jgi:hypothetical protein
MKNAFLLVTAEFFYFVLILLIFPSLVIINRLGPTSLDSQKILPLISNKPISFKIDHPPEGLNSISFELKNPNLQNYDQINVDIFDNHHNVLKATNFFGSNVGDPSRIDLKFEPLKLDPSSPIYVQLTLESKGAFFPILYIADKNEKPVYFTTYKNQNIIQSLKYNLNLQLEKTKHQSPFHLFSYIALIFLLNYLILKPDVNKKY